MLNYRTVIIKHGFLPDEADEFIKAKAPDGTKQDFDVIFHSEPFQDMLKSRLRWQHDLRVLGWSPRRIAQAIKDYYIKKAGRSPFDFLKIEYKPPKPQTDYAWAVKVRAKARISRMSKQHFGVRYSPPLKRQWRPKEPSPLRPIQPPEQ